MASRFSRFTNAISRATRAFFDALSTPPPPREPYPTPTEPVYGPQVPPYDYTQYEYRIPTDSGEWIAQPTEPARLVEEEPYWMGEEVDIYDANGFLVEVDDTLEQPRTFEEWYNVAQLPKRYLIEEYGVDNIQILKELERQGYYIDWDAFWQEYHERYAA